MLSTIIVNVNKIRKIASKSTTTTTNSGKSRKNYREKSNCIEKPQLINASKSKGKKIFNAQRKSKTKWVEIVQDDLYLNAMDGI